MGTSGAISFSMRWAVAAKKCGAQVPWDNALHVPDGKMCAGTLETGGGEWAVTGVAGCDTGHLLQGELLWQSPSAQSFDFRCSQYQQKNSLLKYLEG